MILLILHYQIILSYQVSEDLNQVLIVHNITEQRLIMMLPLKDWGRGRKSNFTNTCESKMLKLHTLNFSIDVWVGGATLTPSILLGILENLTNMYRFYRFYLEKNLLLKLRDRQGNKTQASCSHTSYSGCDMRHMHASGKQELGGFPSTIVIKGDFFVRREGRERTRLRIMVWFRRKIETCLLFLSVVRRARIIYLERL